MRSATRLLVSTFGGLVAIAGIEHGIGEVLQGSTPPSSVVILSWPGAAPFEALVGEPAMTLVPNLLATGLLALYEPEVLFGGYRIIRVNLGN